MPCALTFAPTCTNPSQDTLAERMNVSQEILISEKTALALIFRIMLTLSLGEFPAFDVAMQVQSHFGHINLIPLTMYEQSTGKSSHFSVYKVILPMGSQTLALDYLNIILPVATFSLAYNPFVPKKAENIRSHDQMRCSSAPV